MICVFLANNSCKWRSFSFEIRRLWTWYNRLNHFVLLPKENVARYSSWKICCFNTEELWLWNSNILFKLLWVNQIMHFTARTAKIHYGIVHWILLWRCCNRGVFLNSSFFSNVTTSWKLNSQTDIFHVSRGMGVTTNLQHVVMTVLNWTWAHLSPLPSSLSGSSL